jgi:bifunctional DNA-binding transcriptional regulator/antitoxin component of YhaV-PrlF toxin-antitoxin module
MTTIVTEGNKVMIPGEIADALGIKPGTQLDWASAESPGKLVVTIVPDRSEMVRSLYGAGQKYLKPGDDPVGDLMRDRLREDADRSSSL